MMLGSDVSGLSTTAATAAAQGLSIVVPVYNEAAGLALLHQRLVELARKLRQRYGLGCEVVYVDDGSADATLSIARGLAADALDVQVVSLSRNFGKEAALMAGLDHARRGAVLFMDQQPNSFQTASLSMNEPITRSLGPEAPRALVKFAPDARVADITTLLDSYQASIVDARGGMFRLQFGTKAMSKDELANLMNRLKGEKIVSLAVAAQ